MFVTNTAEHFFLLFSINWIALISNSQETVDSSYRNYLYDSRTMYFSQLPVAKKSIIFFGDSITQWGDLGELLDFTKVLNRGIAGDNTFGLAARVNEVTRHHPKKVFILIGTNDINKKIPTEYIITNYIKIIQSIKQQSQHTKIYVQSVFPINNQLIGRQYYTGTNEQIQQLNKALKQMAVSQGVTYVDVYSQLLDEKKEEMEKALTYDGLHLSGLGYRQWINVLKEQKLL